MADPIDKARDDFLPEVQEIIETLSRDLLALEGSLGAGPPDPDLVNDAFRAVHTLKGLAGLFGATRMSHLAHELESLLGDLRLGKRGVDRPAMDLLFSGVEAFGRLLAVEKGLSDDPLAEVDQLLLRLRLAAAGDDEPPMSSLPSYDLDPAMLAVLTEYEEHRLRTNVEQGMRLYRLRVLFDLSNIDDAIGELKVRAKPYGEIITYLPTGQGADASTIELDILMASRSDLSAVREALAGPRTAIDEVARTTTERHAANTQPPAPPASLAAQAQPSIPTPAGPQGSLSPKAGVPLGESLRSVTQTVRVDIRKLDMLMNIVGELSIVRNAIGRLTDELKKTPGMRDIGTELHRLHRGFERYLGDMQTGILEVRMVPLGQLFDKLARMVRKISREANKEVNLVITGAETELDKLIVEELSDPMMHMIRNAIDHAIEPKVDRETVGKPTAGTIALNAFQKASHVVIEIEDDGRGIDELGVLAAAVRAGLVDRDEAEALTRAEILSFIFAPGVSTKEDVGELSGRGVGMDVVKTNIAKLGGVIDIQSEPGIGTKFTVTLPITLAIISALIVHVKGSTFAIPLAAVQEALLFDETDVRRLEGHEIITLRGASLPLCRLDGLFGLSGDDLGHTADRPYIVVVGVGARRIGLLVDGVLGQDDIVIKSLGASLSRVKGFAGATELGDQRVALVLDALSLVDEVFAGPAVQATDRVGNG
jgi:two-component system, chemotaxis family, sensor kinase CheA